MTPQESQITDVHTDTCWQCIQLMRATHETVVYLHDFHAAHRGKTLNLKSPIICRRASGAWPTIATWQARMTGSPSTATGEVHPCQSLRNTSG